MVAASLCCCIVSCVEAGKGLYEHFLYTNRSCTCSALVKVGADTELISGYRVSSAILRSFIRICWWTCDFRYYRMNAICSSSSFGFLPRYSLSNIERSLFKGPVDCSHFSSFFRPMVVTFSNHRNDIYHDFIVICRRLFISFKRLCTCNF